MIELSESTLTLAASGQCRADPDEEAEEAGHWPNPQSPSLTLIAIYVCRAALEEQEEEEEAEEGPKGPQRGVYPRDFGRQSTKAPVREERGVRCAPLLHHSGVSNCVWHGQMDAQQLGTEAIH